VDVQGDRRAPAYSRERLAEVARRYYLEDRTKLDIARETGLSRFAVARMLDRARALGVVTIAVEGVNAGPRVPTPRPAFREARLSDHQAHPALDDELSTRLAERLGVDEAVVVEASGPPSEVSLAVGVAAARWVESCVAAGDVVAWAAADGSPGSPARVAAAAFDPPVGVGVADLPTSQGAHAGAADRAREDAWEAITVVLLDPAIAESTAGLRRVPHVVVVGAGADAAGALVDAALSGPATVMVTDAGAARAILDAARPTDG
jgi:DNA-binding transcriptional regulator LsrR (DeoR family)